MCHIFSHRVVQYIVLWYITYKYKHFFSRLFRAWTRGGWVSKKYSVHERRDKNFFDRLGDGKWVFYMPRKFWWPMLIGGTKWFLVDVEIWLGNRLENTYAYLEASGGTHPLLPTGRMYGSAEHPAPSRTTYVRSKFSTAFSWSNPAFFRWNLKQL